MTIELSPEVEASLRETAARRGVSVEDYLASLAGGVPALDRGVGLDGEDDTEDDSVPVPTRPAEILKYWERAGIHKTAPSGPDSPVLVRQRRQAEEAERQRRLFGRR